MIIVVKLLILQLFRVFIHKYYLKILSIQTLLKLFAHMFGTVIQTLIRLINSPKQLLILLTMIRTDKITSSNQAIYGIILFKLSRYQIHLY